MPLPSRPSERSYSTCARLYEAPFHREEEYERVVREQHYASTSSVSQLRHKILSFLGLQQGNHACHGPLNGRLCGSVLAKELDIMLPIYSEEQRAAFLARFDTHRMRRTGVRPTPWLSIGRRLIDPPWPLPRWIWPDVPHTSLNSWSSCGPAFFYANEYVDLSIFRNFFSQPHPLFGGTYIEIGGSNGVHASNTLFFEQHLNWTGVLIEPSPCGRCVLPYTRPRDLTINAAVCRKPGNVSRTYMASSFCPSPQDYCVRSDTLKHDGHTLACLPMHRLLPNELRHVDFFSIDVEERVMDVLHTFPWSRVTVDVILAECRGAELYGLCTAFLKRRGFRIHSKLNFGYDVLAVRELCIANISDPRW